MSDVAERFVRYCAIPSQSDPERDIADPACIPTTEGQRLVAEAVAEDLKALGAEDVTVDDHAYTIAHWPATPGLEELPTLGFCCHLDTSWEAGDGAVRPLVRRYEGGIFEIGLDRDGRPVRIGPDTNPELAHMAGWELVTGDGTSLLGGDDKAGIAELVELLARLKDDPSIRHPRLALAFVPDEELGHGAALLDIERFGADFGYTIDAGPLGEFCWETFNAAEAKVRAAGISVHTGTAKGMMVNACEAIMQFHAILPPQERPEYTEGREGFYYLDRMEGSCEEAEAVYIIRDHRQELVEKRKETMRRAAELVNLQYGHEVLTLEIRDQYRNLADVVGRPEHRHLIERAREAYRLIGTEMHAIPMRGGTDGSQLSFRGFPCCNLSAGYHNAHGVREFVPVPELEAMVDMLTELVQLYAEEV